MSAEGSSPEHGWERRRRETRRALRDAALDLGLAHGLGEITVEAIAARAGVSTRTFFNYFDTKEEAALFDLFTVPAADLAAFAASSDTESVWADLTALFLADVDRVEHDGPDLPRYMALQERHPALRGRQLDRFARFEAALAGAITARLGQGEAGRLLAEVMSGSCITAVRVGLQQWGATGWIGPARVHVAAAFALLAPAFIDVAEHAAARPTPPSGKSAGARPA